MKNLILLLAFSLIVLNTEAMPEKNPKPELTEAQQIRMTEIENRLKEIKGMDFKSMSKSEIKEVRAEMKEMKEDARAMGNGIYLSIGAIIIIILLLILLL
ncbi:hypothetical protein GCM10009119_02700 [Algoriphagus jejuensis]|uniref:Seryl-tRNA synthetase n=1 Tax=Algoriphagus jejuensis TaxID=419934 RepID=A0ABN1MW05_9BACT